MKKQSFILITISFLFTTVITACENKTPKDRLNEININKESYKALPPCEQIRIFAEIGFEFVDVDHAEVLMPGWIFKFKEVLKNSTEINSNCIEQELLSYFSLIEETQNSYSYRDTSLKIHSLFYLSEDLGLLRDPEINALLRATVCEEKVQYSGRLLFIYYFTQENDLPEDMEEQKLEVCSNS